MQKLLILLLLLPFTAFPQQRLILDLNADSGLVLNDGNRVEQWTNTVPGTELHSFTKRDEGRKVPGSGRPTLKKNVAELNGHNTLVFLKQELLNRSETACDSLITGQGFTWIAVLKPYTQIGQLKDVNCFFGSLKNKFKNEGFWAGFTDDNRLWTGARNGITFGRWDENNPFIATPEPLDTTRYYLLAATMGAGTGKVAIRVFVNDMETPVTTGLFPVSTSANGSMLSIGQERDAIEHPGVESFRGELARFMLYNYPLSEKELKKQGKLLKRFYRLRPN